MSKLKKILEKQNDLFVLIAGIALVIFGIYQFMNISAMEEAGQPVRIKKILQYIYNLGGKYVILAIFEIGGAVAIFAGVRQLKDKE